MAKPILSICIPTFNRCELLDVTLSNITSDSLFVNTDDIQIVISDNCSTDNTEAICNKYVVRFPSKIKYIRQKESVLAPFNIYGALDFADGEYLKLQNDNVYFSNLGLAKLIGVIKEEQKDIIFCINRENETKIKLKYFYNINDIVDNISFMTTWMCAHCYKAETYRKLERNDRYLKEWLGSVDMLFRMLAEGASFVCYYENIFISQAINKNVEQYNIAEVFGKNYISLLREYVDKKLLSKSVLAKEKMKALLEHVNPFYFDLDKKVTSQKSGYFRYLLSDYMCEPYFYGAYILILFKMLFALFVNIKKGDIYRYITILGFIKFKIKRKGKVAEFEFGEDLIPIITQHLRILYILRKFLWEMALMVKLMLYFPVKVMKVL